MKKSNYPSKSKPSLKLRYFFPMLSIALPCGAASVGLGAADSFAVLGGSEVTDAGGSTFFGDVGVSPGSAITGILPAQVQGGSLHFNDALAMSAHTDASTAYGVLAGLGAGTNLTGQNLGGLVLTPGV